MNNNEILFYVTRYFDWYPFLLPLGLIGVWRWGIWFTKKIVGFYYRPKSASFKTSVSLITPVYNENPDTFTRALTSWKNNKPEEIIAVIDYSDKICIKIFSEFAKKNANAKLVITKIPGKREALATGIKEAKSEVVALVDSDTIWDKDTLKNSLAPFANKQIGGVATKQSVEKPRTIAQKLFSIRLEQRYWDDIPFLSVAEDVLVCLSGRTALYRRKALLPMLDKLVNETFMGEKAISGEDKRLTYLIEATGWKTAYQSNARVITTGVADMSTFIKQQIRWTRNSWRNDLRALGDKWVFKHPVFALYLLDRAIQPFTLLISPVYFVVSVFLNLWIPVITILIWWHISRFIKMFPHLRKYPLDIWMLPIFILFNFVSAYIRLYALFSLNLQGWITRWDKSRLPQFRRLQLLRGHVMTLTMFGVVALGVVVNKNNNYFIPQEQQRQLVARTLQKKPSTLAAKSPDVLGASTVDPKKQLSSKYEFQSFDSLGSVAQKFGIGYNSLLFANVQKITNWTRIKPGTIFSIPPAGLEIAPVYRFNYRRIYDDYLQIWYDPQSNTIVLGGRGYSASLNDLMNAVGEKYLEEVSPKVWQLRANILLRSGSTLKLEKEEATWLRLASSKDGFVSIRGSNADLLIDGVKITSWDEKNNDYDKNYQDGRSYIAIKNSARMDVINSEIAYMGFPRPKDYPYSPYGISWKLSNSLLKTVLLTGEVIGSKFHDNYFGAYTFGATGMIWRNNEFYDNVRYGLDPHDDSNGFLIENNKFYNNGTHGLILSKRCVNNTIRNNISYENELHGIMLHELSNNNVIENNTIYDNFDGVDLDNSSKNIVRNNKIYDNKRGFLADKKSLDNLVVNNQITNSSQYGIYLYDQAHNNTIKNNSLAYNATGIYIKTDGNNIADNKLDQNEMGIYFFGNAKNNIVEGNDILYSKIYGIYAKMYDGVSNFLGENNSLIKNYKKDQAAFALE